MEILMTYTKLSTATVGTATEMLPKKKSVTRNSPSHTQNGTEAREKLKSTSLNYHAAKKNLDNAYIQT